MSSSTLPKLVGRAAAVALLCVGILAMHGFTTVGTEHSGETGPHSTSRLLGDIARIAPADANEGMSIDMHMLSVCLGVMLTSIGAVGLACAYIRVRPLRDAGATGASSDPLASCAGRSPPHQRTPVQFVVILT